MILSIIELRLIIKALQSLHDETSGDAEYQRLQRYQCKKLMASCDRKIGDIEAIGVE